MGPNVLEADHQSTNNFEINLQCFLDRKQNWRHRHKTMMQMSGWQRIGISTKGCCTFITCKISVTSVTWFQLAYTSFRSYLIFEFVLVRPLRFGEFIKVDIGSRNNPDIHTAIVS